MTDYQLTTLGALYADAARPKPRIGSLCTGFGGLDMAAEEVFGAETAWVSDIDKGACKILDHRYPDVPNIGDFTVMDWSTVEPVEVVTAGFPCQPVSHAGKRLGDEDERWLWDDVARAVRELRPGHVVLENVRGLLTAGSGRLFGRVLGTLADLGYDAVWHGLRAADVGAPHSRFRVFIVATAADARGSGRLGWSGLQGEGRDAAERGEEVGHSGHGNRALRRWREGWAGSSGDLMLPSAVMLLPTPACNDMGAGKTVEAWDAWTADMQAKHGNGNGHGKSLSIEAQRLAVPTLLPTPTATDHKASGGNPQTTGTHGTTLTDATVREPNRWGDYAAAIERWEAITRPAPAPTVPDGRNGAHRLNPRFVEWLMGCPDGWVCDVPGITRNEALKALGNGVVKAQAVAAIRWSLARLERVAA